MRPIRSLALAACAVIGAFIISACDGQRSTVAAAANADVYDRVMASKTVRIGVKPDTPPFGMQLGSNFIGFDVDIAQALANRLGIEHVEFVPVTSANRIDKLTGGEVDMVIASMTITRFRENRKDYPNKRVDFTIPYFQDGQSILVKSDSPIRSYLDLAGHSVGCVKGSTSSFYMKQVSPDAKVETFPDFGALHAALDAGKVEAITSDLIILAGIVKNSPDPDVYRIAGERFTVEPYGIAVPQNQSAWRNALNHALIELWEEGQYQEIVKTWFGPGKKYQVPVNFSIGVYPK